MAIAIRAQGAAISGVANIGPAIPTAQLTGDMMVCVYGTKPFDDVPTIDQGWSDLLGSTDGTVAAGVDIGSMQTRLFYKIATSDTEPNPIVTNSTNNISTAYILVFSKGASETWSTPVAEGGGDATAGTGFSVTVGSDIGIRAGDFVVVGCAFRSDAATPVTANVDITATGCTFTDTKALATDPETTSGGDMGMSGDIAECTAGPSSAAAVITATLAASHTGSARIARLRVTNPVLATPGTLALSLATFAATVLTPRLVTPSTLSLITSLFAPAVTVGVLVTPAVASLLTTAFAPTVSTPRLVTPGTLALVTSLFAPTVSTPRLVTPGTLVLVTTAFAPAVTGGADGLSTTLCVGRGATKRRYHSWKRPPAGYEDRSK